MTNEQPRTDASNREHSPDHQYSLSIEHAAELYAQAGHPRTVRAIQKYCALSKLDCHKVETETGEKYLVAPYSVARHIAYINEVRTVATSRDQTRPDANIRRLENKGEQEQRTPTNSREWTRAGASVLGPDERYVARLEGEVDFLRAQVDTKDSQIKELTERSRETNLLVAGLQKMLTPLLNPAGEWREGRAGGGEPQV
jgi:hypothetical protein